MGKWIILLIFIALVIVGIIEGISKGEFSPKEEANYPPPTSEEYREWKMDRYSDREPLDGWKGF